MYKLAIFLLGLLVILMPIGTSMNGMAITENEYYTDQYTGYAEDMVNYYEDESSYANNDGYDGSERDKQYENTNYNREYPSYKHDSNSYGYDDNKYKSKDKDRDGNSVSISKIKCENVNNNFNNVVIGNLNIGNSGSGGRAASYDGTNEAISANAYGNNGERYNNDGYQKDKGITCIINNNNTILSGNETTTPVEECPEAEDIEACFEEFVFSEGFELLTDTLASPAGLTVEINGQEVTLRSFEDICIALESITTYEQVEDAVFNIFEGLPGQTFPINGDLIDCIAEVLGIEVDNMGILTPFDVNNGGTEDLTATEKIDKLKAQYSELYQ